jgi:hypothetical protein
MFLKLWFFHHLTSNFNYQKSTISALYFLHFILSSVSVPVFPTETVNMDIAVLYFINNRVITVFKIVFHVHSLNTMFQLLIQIGSILLGTLLLIVKIQQLYIIFLEWSLKNKHFFHFTFVPRTYSYEL